MEISVKDGYIMLEGQKIPLTDEQVKMIKLCRDRKGNTFKRAEVCAKYCFINATGGVHQISDERTAFDTGCFLVANYCIDKERMEQRALHETLNRLLWRYSVESGEANNPWDGDNKHFYIYFHEKKRTFIVDFCWSVHSPCEVYFPTEEVANKAITDVVIPFLTEHPEFVW